LLSHAVTPTPYTVESIAPDHPRTHPPSLNWRQNPKAILFRNVSGPPTLSPARNSRVPFCPHGLKQHTPCVSSSTDHAMLCAVYSRDREGEECITCSGLVSFSRSQ